MDDVCYQVSTKCSATLSELAGLTLELGHGRDLGQELEEVWEVIAQKFGPYNEVLAAVPALQLGTKQLRLALYP